MLELGLARDAGGIAHRHTSSHLGEAESTNPCDKNRGSLSADMSPQRETHGRSVKGPLALPRAAAAALVIRAQSTIDDRSVSVVHVPDPVVDGSAAHVRGTAVFQAPCSPSDFAVLHRQLADGSAIRQRGRRNGTTRQPRALPLWNGQGNAALVPSPNPRQKYNGAHSTSPPGPGGR